MLTDSIVHTLFGHKSELTLSPKDVRPEQRFLIIPGQTGPRWLGPEDARVGLRALSSWRPTRTLSRIKWQIVLALYRSGQLAKLPGVQRIGVNGAQLAATVHYGQLEDTLPVAYIGTPGPFRKLVVTLVTRNGGTPSGILKMPLGPESGKRIIHEAEVLSLLEEEKPGCAPKLIFLDRGRQVSIQSRLIGKISSRSVGIDKLEFLCELSNTGDRTSLNEQSDLLRSQVACIESIEAEDKEFVINLLAYRIPDGDLPSAWVHGDFAPWNLISISEGQLMAVDWEAASRCGLPLSDLVHFYSMQAYLFGSKQSFHYSRDQYIREYMTRLGLPLGMTHSLVVLGLIKDLLQAVENRNECHASFMLQLIKQQKDGTR